MYRWEHSIPDQTNSKVLGRNGWASWRNAGGGGRACMGLLGGRQRKGGRLSFCLEHSERCSQLLRREAGVGRL
jgi:hypothetical protein